MCCVGKVAGDGADRHTVCFLKHKRSQFVTCMLRRVHFQPQLRNSKLFDMVHVDWCAGSFPTRSRTSTACWSVAVLRHPRSHWCGWWNWENETAAGRVERRPFFPALLFTFAPLPPLCRSPLHHTISELCCVDSQSGEESGGVQRVISCLAPDSTTRRGK